MATSPWRHLGVLVSKGMCTLEKQSLEGIHRITEHWNYPAGRVGSKEGQGQMSKEKLSTPFLKEKHNVPLKTPLFALQKPLSAQCRKIKKHRSMNRDYWSAHHQTVSVAVAVVGKRAACEGTRPNRQVNSYFGGISYILAEISKARKATKNPWHQLSDGITSFATFFKPRYAATAPTSSPDPVLQPAAKGQRVLAGRTSTNVADAGRRAANYQPKWHWFHWLEFKMNSAAYSDRHEPTWESFWFCPPNLACTHKLTGSTPNW